MKTILTLLAFTLFSHTYAQNKTADEIAVEKQIDALVASWNNHNYDDIANYATEDAEWVNIVGMQWKNRKEVQFAHQAYHEKMFRNVKLTKNWVRTRKLSADVMLAYMGSRVGAFTTPASIVKPEADNVALLVFVKKEGKWLMTAGENVEVLAPAAADNPVSRMPR